MLPAAPPPGDGPDPASSDGCSDAGESIRSPLEAISSYRGDDWTPQRLAFHQNLETFAERVGLIVALQSNGKLSQETAYAEICSIWSQLRNSKTTLLTDNPPLQP